MLVLDNCMLHHRHITLDPGPTADSWANPVHKSLPALGGLGYLVLLRALAQLSELCVQLCEPASDLLDARMQTAVLVVFSVEVILVALTLL